MQIRPSTKSDMKGILHVALQTDWWNDEAEAKKELTESMKNPFFVAIENKDVLGYMYYSKAYSHEANYLNSVLVSKEHRRKGVAKALINTFIQLSRKETPKSQQWALSSTDVANKASQKMHKKLGFKKIGSLKGLHFGKDEIFYGYKLR